MDWFAITTKPKHEMAAAEQLNAKSVEAYVPIYRERRRWSDRTKIIEAPLFPRYLFCRFQFEDRLKVLQTFSVYSIVTFNGTPCPISESEIETVKRIALGCDLSIAPHPFLRVGQRVRVCEGPLSGVEGILAKEKGTCRVVVTVEAMQRALAVEIDPNFLEPVAERNGLGSEHKIPGLGRMLDGTAGRTPCGVQGAANASGHARLVG
jgi:transcription antitermination factor NusG